MQNKDYQGIENNLLTDEKGNIIIDLNKVPGYKEFMSFRNEGKRLANESKQTIQNNEQGELPEIHGQQS